MVWEEGKVRRCAIGSVVIGLSGAALLGLSFGTTSWLVFPPGHFYLKTHHLYMGLFSDRACVSGTCGTVPDSLVRMETRNDWNTVLALMCTTLSVTLMAAAMNIIILVMPKKIFTVFTGLFWFLSGALNMVSIIIFWHLFEEYEDRMSWSYWVSMISTIIFLIVGITLSIFSCCHRWTTRLSSREPQDTVVVAPPPVVAYRSEHEDGETPKYDFATDPDMQPYSFGGKEYDSNRGGGGGHGSSQSYRI